MLRSYLQSCLMHFAKMVVSPTRICMWIVELMSAHHSCSSICKHTYLQSHSQFQCFSLLPHSIIVPSGTSGGFPSSSPSFLKLSLLWSFGQDHWKAWMAAALVRKFGFHGPHGSQFTWPLSAWQSFPPSASARLFTFLKLALYIVLSIYSCNNRFSEFTPFIILKNVSTTSLTEI